MKKLILIAVALSLFIACDEKPKNPVAEYGDVLIDSYKRGQAAGEAANLDAVKKTVQLYYASNGRYPAGLDEIKDSFSSQIDLSKYDYNPQTGVVRLR